MSYFVQTGQWTGYYEQKQKQTPMTFKQFYITPVPQGHVKGKGQDTVGKFQIVGSFNNNATAVRFAKTYSGKYNHTIYYQGEFTGNAIQGTWAFDIDTIGADKFKISMD